MWHVGIDLHRETIMRAAVNDAGEAMNPIRIRCEDTAEITRVFQVLTPFRAVIEASGTYRWLYDLLRPYGAILLAHPLRLRAMVQRRTNVGVRERENVNKTSMPPWTPASLSPFRFYLYNEKRGLDMPAVMGG